MDAGEPQNNITAATGRDRLANLVEILARHTFCRWILRNHEQVGIGPAKIYIPFLLEVNTANFFPIHSITETVEYECVWLVLANALNVIRSGYRRYLSST